MNYRNKNERGSAIIWILIAVGLFAALNFAFNSSSRTSTSLLDDAEAGAYAKEIIQYGNEVKAAVQRLKLRGCDDTEISFENSISAANYTNASSPSSRKCHVFETAGGGINWKNFKQENIMTGFNPSIADWYFSGADQVLSAGADCADSSCTELMLTALGLRRDICEAINDNLNITNTIVDAASEDIVGAPAFTGTYTYNAAYIVGDDATELDGVKSACYSDTSCGGGNCYVYYQVLLSR